MAFLFVSLFVVCLVLHVSLCTCIQPRFFLCRPESLDILTLEFTLVTIIEIHVGNIIIAGLSWGYAIVGNLLKSEALTHCDTQL